MSSTPPNWDSVSLVTITPSGTETSLLLDQPNRSTCSCSNTASTDVLVLVRLNNLLLLLIVSVLIASGHGRMDNSVLHLSISSWSHVKDPPQEPQLYDYLDANKQFAAFGTSVLFSLLTLYFLVKQCRRRPPHKVLGWLYAFSGIPCMLAVFCVEVYYANCPWLDFYYRKAMFDAHPAVMSTALHIHRHKCTMTAWSAAAGLCLISCGLFVTDGLISCLSRPYRVLNESSSSLNSESSAL